MPDKAVFKAIVAPIQSACKIGPDGMRLQLDVAEQDLADALHVLAWRDRVIVVTIEPEKRPQ